METPLRRDNWDDELCERQTDNVSGMHRRDVHGGAAEVIALG